MRHSAIDPTVAAGPATTVPTDRVHLERIKSVTDVVLTHVGVDDYLDEVLDRTLEVLDIDTAVVLLMHPSGHDLVATATRGLRLPVGDNARVPLGEGLIGQIATQRRPLAMEDIDEDAVEDPEAVESAPPRRIRAALGAPLLVENELIGVLHVGSISARHFDVDDVEVIELIAERVATAAHLQNLQRENHAAEALQRNLLPTTPDRIGDLELASRYVPSGVGGIGGDWYDAFRLDDGSTWIMVGDVVGHGFAAAVLMGRVRSAMRAYSLLEIQPHEVLALTDRKFFHFEPEHLATVAIVRVAPEGDRANVVLAGHPPPVLTLPGCEPVLVDAPVGLPLGVMKEKIRPEVSVELPVGGSLFLYTDGLVERRNETLDTGLRRLAAAVPDATPPEVCRRVMETLVGTRSPDDDIAMLAARRVGVG